MFGIQSYTFFKKAKIDLYLNYLGLQRIFWKLVAWRLPRKAKPWSGAFSRKETVSDWWWRWRWHHQSGQGGIRDEGMSVGCQTRMTAGGGEEQPFKTLSAICESLITCNYWSKKEWLIGGCRKWNCCDQWPVHGWMWIQMGLLNSLGYYM